MGNTINPTNTQMAVHKAQVAGLPIEVKAGERAREASEPKRVRPLAQTKEVKTNEGTKLKPFSNKETTKNTGFGRIEEEYLSPVYERDSEESRSEDSKKEEFLPQLYQKQYPKQKQKLTPFELLGRNDSIWQANLFYEIELKERQNFARGNKAQKENKTQDDNELPLNFWQKNRNNLLSLVQTELRQYNLQCDPLYTRQALRDAVSSLQGMNTAGNTANNRKPQNNFMSVSAENHQSDSNPDADEYETPFDILSFIKATKTLLIFDEEEQEKLIPTLETVA